MNITLPPHFDSLENALASLFGDSITVIGKQRVSGGDINRAYALTLSNGKRIFMKANDRENAAFFTAEAAGLSAIAGTGTIGTPEILCTGTDDIDIGGFSFLLLEFIESAGRRSDYWEELGHNLAAMHDAPTEDSAFGFFQDNFVGARPQINTRCDSWISFFRDYRLAPQFKAADSYFSSRDRTLNTRLMDHLDEFLVEPEKPSLVHGDLWNGNVMCGPDGKAMLIDPACYIGHAEVDLAMTELFGGFPHSFYASYNEVRPLQPGYPTRRNLYNLYQLLNHLNLFGPGYLGSVQSIVEKYVR